MSPLLVILALLGSCCLIGILLRQFSTTMAQLQKLNEELRGNDRRLHRVIDELRARKNEKEESDNG